MCRSDESDNSDQDGASPSYVRTSAPSSSHYYPPSRGASGLVSAGFSTFRAEEDGLNNKEEMQLRRQAAMGDYHDHGDYDHEGSYEGCGDGDLMMDDDVDVRSDGGESNWSDDSAVMRCF